MRGDSHSVVFVLFCALLLTTIFADDAAACVCRFGGEPVCQEYSRTDIVFAGTVAGSAKITVNEGDYKYEQRLVRFEIAEMFRGEQMAKAEIITGWGGGDCGYNFTNGESYLVYAHINKENKRLYTSVCTRTRPTSQAAEDLAYIRNLPYMDAAAVIFGKITRLTYKEKDGQAVFLPVGSTNLIIEGESSRNEAQTDEQGGYRVTGLAPGAYKVRLKVPDGLTSNGMRGGAMIEEKAEVVERGCQQVDFGFVSDTRVSGRVIDAIGRPMTGLNVQMRGASSDLRNTNTFLYANTNAGGRFEFETVPPGDYLLGFRILGTIGGEMPYPRTYYPGVAFKSLAGVVSVKEGELRSDIELKLPPPLPEFSVKGFVVWSDGRPAPDVAIYLSLLEEGDITGTKTLQADERGHFTLKVYEGLEYRVSAYNATGAAAQSEWVEAPQTADAKPIKLVLPAPKK
jgi:5-hydroxyisourate hydrolase-like protein (transthyretin family)